MKRVLINENQFNRIFIYEPKDMVNEAVDEGWLKNTAMAGAMGLATMFGGPNANAQNIDTQTNSTHYKMGNVEFEKPTTDETALMSHYVDMGYSKDHKVRPTQEGLQFYQNVMKTKDIKNVVSDDNYQLLYKWMSKNFNKLSNEKRNNVISTPTNNTEIALALTKLVKAEVKIGGMYYIMNYKDTKTMNNFIIILPYNFVSKILPK